MSTPVLFRQIGRYAPSSIRAPSFRSMVSGVNFVKFSLPVFHKMSELSVYTIDPSELINVSFELSTYTLVMYIATSRSSFDAVCKRLKKYKEGLELISNNPNYASIYFDDETIKTKPVRIIGKVVELRAKF